MSTTAAPAAAEPPTPPRPDATPAPDPSTFIRVHTTLPRPSALPPITARRILTNRLVLRSAAERDLPALHVLRTQAEVMRWTARGRPDRDFEETRAWVRNWLPPSPEGKEEEEQPPSFNFVICLRRGEGEGKVRELEGMLKSGDSGDKDGVEEEDGKRDEKVGEEEAEEGEVIGVGGCHRWKGLFGWPEVGYMIRQEVWGKGLATEFLEGWLEVWEGLEREELEIEVDERTILGLTEGSGKRERGGVEVVKVREQLVAITAEGNEKSQRVLGKRGFEWFTTWLADDLTQTQREGEKKMVELPTYRRFLEQR
ncbi:hypothetical protein VTJ49DRAFT_97 [Mycothermus thermophilus]|uniref:N-acetyltransferase domain-containing protein n=1 Tax=Humicola insolens TaxID=85995 RepID=A0ABR3VQA5_HUMIN